MGGGAMVWHNWNYSPLKMRKVSSNVCEDRHHQYQSTFNQTLHYSKINWHCKTEHLGTMFKDVY